MIAKLVHPNDLI